MHVFAAPSPFSFSAPSPQTGTDTALARRHCEEDSEALVILIRKHHRAIFHLCHALLRDEVVSERITQQVFSRARRRLRQGVQTPSLTGWLYYAGLRFARRHYWNSLPRPARRKMAAPLSPQPRLDLWTFVTVIVRCQGKIDPRDCELLALGHVLHLPHADIARLLRMHPYEVSNRLVWARERVLKLRQQLPPCVEASRASLTLSA